MGAAEPAVAADRAGITGFRGVKSTEPARLLNFIVRRQGSRMNEIRLRPVTFAELSDLRHETLASEQQPFLTPEFLVIRYIGVYRPGSAGRGDALYIVATAKAAREAWYSNSTILDFREL